MMRRSAANQFTLSRSICSRFFWGGEAISLAHAAMRAQKASATLWPKATGAADTFCQYDRRTPCRDRATHQFWSLGEADQGSGCSDGAPHPADADAQGGAVGKSAQGGDLIAFRKEYDKANLGSLVERCSRYTVLRRNPSRHSVGVMAGIDQGLRPLPPSLRRSMTFDRGTEFSTYGVLKQKLGVTSYFCQPSAPWQKGSVENNNGRIRRFLPLDCDIALISDTELAAIANRLNQTPRKCLGYRTPHEVLTEQIMFAKQT